MSAGLILFAHGSRDAQWAQPFERLAEAVRKTFHGPVSLAYLELMQPSLAEAIDVMAREGATSIRVVPVFLGQGGHVKRDLPQLARAAGERHRGVVITVEPAIGEQPEVIAAIAAAIMAKN